MPNYPSIYLELQELWKRIRNNDADLAVIKTDIVDIKVDILDLKDRTACITHKTIPYEATVINCSLEQGEDTVASGDRSHAQGNGSQAIGNYSHAEGRDTRAEYYYSHAEGIGTIASGEGSHSEGYYTTASGLYSHAEGSGTICSAQAGHTEGYYTKVTNDAAHSEGYFTTASGKYSHSEGYQARAVGQASHAEGYKTTASAVYSHAEGESTTTFGQASHSEGYDTTAFAFASHAEGYGTRADQNYSHAEGESTLANGTGSHSEGYMTTASANYQHVQGKYNQTSSTAIMIVGNGTDEDNRSNAIEVDVLSLKHVLFYPTSSVNDAEREYALYVDKFGIKSPAIGIVNASGTLSKITINDNGINFNINANYSGETSSTLDDYEEGTWIPQFSGSTGGGIGLNYTFNSGSYIKIGKSVTVNGRIDLNTTSSAPSGDLLITGLPYASKNYFNGTNIYWQGLCSYVNMGGGTVYWCQMDDANNYLKVKKDYNLDVDCNVLTASQSDISFNITYFTN